jgi:hypothetical protein
VTGVADEAAGRSACRSSSAGVEVAACAYAESVSARTKIAVAMLRPYDEGMRPVIPRGYWWALDGVGRRGDSSQAKIAPSVN